MIYHSRIRFALKSPDSPCCTIPAQSRLRVARCHGANRREKCPESELCFAPGAFNGAIPSNDPYETNFIDDGQRSILRQSWQRRADISLTKITEITERSSLKFTFDIFNVTNTASFDIPIDDVTQNINFNGFPAAGQSLYVSPTLSGLGITNKTIESPTQIQMSLSFMF